MPEEGSSMVFRKRSRNAREASGFCPRNSARRVCISFRNSLFCSRTVTEQLRLFGIRLGPSKAHPEFCLACDLPVYEQSGYRDKKKTGDQKGINTGCDHFVQAR